MRVTNEHAPANRPPIAAFLHMRTWPRAKVHDRAGVRRPTGNQTTAHERAARLRPFSGAPLAFHFKPGAAPELRSAGVGWMLAAATGSACAGPLSPRNPSVPTRKGAGGGPTLCGGLYFRAVKPAPPTR